MNITTVIVTFNRKNDLLRCIDAVLGQTYKTTNLVIVNNASSDGTEDILLEYFNCENKEHEKNQLRKVGTKDSTTVYLYSNEKNTGGAGGFHVGLKNAHEKLKPDYFWLMDDDGYPTPNCLEQLLLYVDNYNYIMPTSIDINNHSQLSWPTHTRNGKKTILYDELKESWGAIMDYVTPFNGVLLSKNCVDRVGYINKDFFIWGDDYEHYYRCKKNGIHPVTLISAQFYHPAQKVMLKKIFFGLFQVAYSDSPLRMICLARNWTYIYLHYNQRWKIPVKWIMYWWLFIITRRGDFAGWRLYRQSVRDGIKGDFTRHLLFLDKT